MRTRSVNWLRRSALALVGALALAAASGAGPSAQEASAAPYKSLLCYMIVEDGQLKVYCQDIEVEWPWDKFFDCWMCGLGFDWRHDPVIREDLQGLVSQYTVKGLTTLGTAEFTSNPTLRQQLRARALEEFGVAARYAGESRVTLGAAGLADAANNRFDPSPDPWTQAAGTDIADGVTLMQQAARNPRDAARLRALAAAQFDEAYAELSGQRVIG